MKRIFLLAAFVCLTTFAQPPKLTQFMLKVEPVRKDFTLQNATPEERPILTAHANYLRKLIADGKLTFAGQAFDPKGMWGVIVVNAPDADAATAILNGDPSILSNVFRGEVIPFRTVFAAPSPLPLTPPPAPKP